VSTHMEKFFEPESIAIVGASATPHKPGNDVIRNILANGYEGKLYLVNPKGGEILGIKVHRAVSDLPEGIDLAVVILPARANPRAVRDCASRGIKAIVLAAGGFAEVDADGESLQEELKEAIRETGVRVLGPNTSGHTSTPHRFTSSFFPLGALPKGPISYIAQTGNFATHTMRYIKSAEHFGVARVAGLGRHLRVPGEFQATPAVHGNRRTSHPRQTHDPPQGRKLGGRIKGGRGPHGGPGVGRSHNRRRPETGGYFQDPQVLPSLPGCQGPGHDALARGQPGELPCPVGRHAGLPHRLLREAPQSSGTFGGRGDPGTAPGNQPPFPTVHGVEYGYREGMEAVLKDPNIDAVVPVLLFTDETGVPSLDFIVELAEKYPQKPIYVTSSGQKKHMEAAKEFLEPRGVPTFPLIEDPFEILDILCRCRKALETPWRPR